jgi:signal transduction histidine kinase
MNYQIGIVVALILAIALAVKILWRKLRENQSVKYEFITIIAHKFRTPLTEIKWTIDTVMENESDPYLRKSLTDIQKASDKLAALMGTLIELTNKDTGAGLAYIFERTLIYDFVREIGDGLRNSFQEKNISFSVQCADPTLAVFINKIGMRFVLQALIENSCVYSPPGRRVDVVIFQKHRKVYISITDDGIGIRPRDLSKVFGKFYRARNAKRMDTEGFGVSLFMAQSITRRNHGVIRAFSEGIDRGSTFTIIVPRVK